jgi:hypothetical protein
MRVARKWLAFAIGTATAKGGALLEFASRLASRRFLTTIGWRAAVAARMIAPGVCAARDPVVAPALVPRTFIPRPLATIARETLTFTGPFIVARAFVVRAIAARLAPEWALAAWSVVTKSLATRLVEFGAIEFAWSAIACGRPRRAVIPRAIKLWPIALLAKAAARFRSKRTIGAEAPTGLCAAETLATGAVITAFVARRVAMRLAVRTAAHLARRARTIVVATTFVGRKALAARPAVAWRPAPAVSVIVTRHVNLDSRLRA